MRSVKMMNVALLFNSRLSTLRGSWGPPVMERILGTRVLQGTNRYMRVSVGDILTFSAASEAEIRTLSGFVRLCNRVYRPKKFDRPSGSARCHAWKGNGVLLALPKYD